MKKLFLVLAVAIVFSGVFAVQQVDAGVCANFCKRTTTSPSNDSGEIIRYLNRSNTPCTLGTECTFSNAAPTCDSSWQVTSISDARLICNSSFLARNDSLRAGSADVCGRIRNEQFLSTSNPQIYCMLASTEVTRPAETNINPTVNDTPAPQPATPGDQFRCRYLCDGETQARDGVMCTGTSDQAACIRQCITACGPRMPDGGGCAGLDRSNQPEFRNQQAQPRCIAVATPSSTPATPSVGGITDTGRFETINESFTNISVAGFLGGLIKVLIGIAGSVFFLFMVWGGIRWMIAGGDPAEVTAAQSTIKNAVVGVILLALSYTIVTAFLNIATSFIPR